MVVAAANGVGGDGCVRESEREEVEERNEGEGESEGVQGVALASSRRDEGEPGRLGGRRWPGRVRARVGRTRVLLTEEEGDRGVAVAGWAGSGGLGCWWATR